MSDAAPVVDRRALLTQCRIAVEKRLQDQLVPLLDALPPQLEELLRNTRDREEREQYSNALSRLSEGRDRFMGAFRGEFESRFDACARALEGMGQFLREPGREELAAMKTNMVENEVAVGKLAAMIKGHATADLAALSARFATLFRRPAVDDGDNPVGPLAVARGVYAGVSVLGIEGRALRAVRTELEKNFLAPVGELYRKLNEIFASKGIEPAHAPAGFAHGPAAAAAAQSAAADASRAAAEQALESALGGMELAPVLDMFLRQIWVGVLARAHAAQGATWQQVVETTKALVWSLQPKPDPAERAKLVSLLPTILKRVTTGLEGELDEGGRKLVLDELMAQHREILHPPAKAGAASAR